MGVGHLLSEFSGQLAGLVESAASSTVQIHGRHARPASGTVFAAGHVLMAAHALDHRNGLAVRGSDGGLLPAELAGVDASTDLAVLRAPGLAAPALVPSAEARVGGLAVSLGRTWSGAVAASVGTVSVVGGPLRTGRGPAIEQVIRADVRVHPLGAGGPLVDAAGAALGVATGVALRGLPLFIPGGIAWRVADALAAQGRIKRGYLGISAQSVHIPDAQRSGTAHDTGLLVVGVAGDSPAARTLLVGDVVVGFDGEAIRHHDDLLARLTGDRVGKTVPIEVIRGGDVRTLSIEVAEQR
jgi:S1-C subfamily serine protease